MPTAQGQPATFTFWNLSPSTSYSVKLTAGATYTGAVFSSASVFTNVVVTSAQLSFETVASDSQWLSGAVSVGLAITWYCKSTAWAAPRFRPALSRSISALTFRPPV